MMAKRKIVICNSDMERLNVLIKGRSDRPGDADPARGPLAREIAQAHVVKNHELPPDAVALGSRVSILDEDSDEVVEYQIVLPHEASLDENRVSVMSPIGTALLGYRTGDRVRWNVPAGPRTWRVGRVDQRPSDDATVDPVFDDPVKVKARQ